MRQHGPALAYFLFTLGVGVATYGHLGDDREAMNVGLLICLATAPLCVIAAIFRALNVADSRLADSHYEGYQLALRHCSLGLLDHPEHTPPRGNPIVDADNVHTLPTRHESGDNPPKRAAQ